MAEYSRPYFNIKKGTLPTDQYKSGKAIALLFVLDFLTHHAEGRCIRILDQTEQYLKDELKKLNIELEVKTDKVHINSIDDIEVHLNMNRADPTKEGTI